MAHVADVECGGVSIMLRNIPNRITQEQLVEALDDAGLRSVRFAVHVPRGARRGVNVGYAFVKFESQADADAHSAKIDGLTFSSSNSKKVTRVCPAYTDTVGTAVWGAFGSAGPPRAEGGIESGAATRSGSPDAKSETSLTTASGSDSGSIGDATPGFYSASWPLSPPPGLDSPVTGPTTLMLRNIPNRMTHDGLCAFLNASGIAGTGYTVRLPRGARSGVSAGYAFIEFESAVDAAACMPKINGIRFEGTNSQKVTQVTFATAPKVRADLEDSCAVHGGGGHSRSTHVVTLRNVPHPMTEARLRGWLAAQGCGAMQYAVHIPSVTARGENGACAYLYFDSPHEAAACVHLVVGLRFEEKPAQNTTAFYPYESQSWTNYPYARSNWGEW
uniref:RRM domain-containing protein n=1 Tax=Oxyrrhis marina TaxID=2969 RepID=A0A7S4LNQ1_OXYMA